MEPIRIAIVNNSKDYRNAIRYLLKKISDIVIVGEAQNAAEFIDLAKKLPIDVALVDTKIPITNGITASYQIDKLNTPNLKIVLVSMYNGMDYLMATINCSSTGFIQNKDAFRSLVKAIRSVASNKQYYGNPYSNYNYALN